MRHGLIIAAANRVLQQNPPPVPVLPQIASATLLLDLRAKHGVTMNSTPYAGTGTITQPFGDNVVVGIGTTFRSEVVIGDRITSVGGAIDGIVTSVTDDATLGIDTITTVLVGVAFNVVPQTTTARVTVWADQSGNGRDLTQTYPLNCPILSAGGGNPFIKTTAVNQQWMLGQNWAALDGLASFTVFIVNNGPLGITKIANNGCTDPGCTGWAVSGKSIALYTDSSNYVYQYSTQPTVKSVWTYEVKSNMDPNVYVNGVLDDQCGPGGCVGGAGASAFSNSEPIRFGIDGAASGCDNYKTDDTYAILVYAPAPNPTDRAAIEAWLATNP